MRRFCDNCGKPISKGLVKMVGSVGNGKRNSSWSSDSFKMECICSECSDKTACKK